MGKAMCMFLLRNNQNRTWSHLKTLPKLHTDPSKKGNSLTGTRGISNEFLLGPMVMVYNYTIVVVAQLCQYTKTPLNCVFSMGEYYGM